jgi:hypothetical protein
MATFWMIVIIGLVVLGAVYAGTRPQTQNSKDIQEIICTNTNCGYKGKPGREKYRSNIVLVFLFCLWIIPGIAYAVFVPRYRYWCPQCQTKLKI